MFKQPIQPVKELRKHRKRFYRPCLELPLDWPTPTCVATRFKKSTPAIQKATAALSADCAAYAARCASSSRPFVLKNFMKQFEYHELTDAHNEIALRSSSHDLTLLDHKLAGNHEERSNADRNRIRLGCSVIHRHMAKQQKDHLIPTCPCCTLPLTATHVLLDCSHNGIRLIRSKLLNELGADASHALRLRKLKELLSPSKWTSDDNKHINNWCTKTSQAFTRAQLAEDNPRLTEILMESPCVTPMLNENVEGEHFIVRYHSGPHKGTWRLKAENYNPFTKTFTLCSTNLDVKNGAWLHIPEQDLNRLFNNGHATHLDNRSQLKLPGLGTIRKGIFLNDNIAGKCCEIKVKNRYKWACITSFNQHTNKHTVTLDGITRNINLNSLLHDKKLRLQPEMLPSTVIDHLRSTPNSPGSLSWQVQLLRPMPKGGRQRNS